MEIVEICNLNLKYKGYCVLRNMHCRGLETIPMWYLELISRWLSCQRRGVIYLKKTLTYLDKQRFYQIASSYNIIFSVTLK